MGFMTWIIDALNDASAWLYEIYLDVYGWVWPFYYTANWFYYLCDVFNTLAWAFYYFSSWVDDISTRIENFLSWDTIWGYITSYIPNIEDIRDWFYNWWGNVWDAIDDWWSTVQDTVHGWIDTAVQGLEGIGGDFLDFWNNLWPTFTTAFNKVHTELDNFWEHTLPNLVSFTWLTTWWSSRIADVQGLINSGFTARNSLWEGWQDMKSNVVDFFTDPVEFIWERFTDWFLGPEG
jgi:phage-related protein